MPPRPADPPADASGLVEIVGAAHVLDDPSSTAGFVTDWTGRYGGARATVVRPASTAEVAAVVRWAAARRTAVVPQGGNTGLVGGSVPGADGALLLSTVRLDEIHDVDLLGGAVTVGAGVTPTALAERLDGTGWRFAVDLGSRGSATIGGMIATNAGGMRVFRHGTMRHQLLGIEYVTAAGDVVSHLGGLLKDNTGYDLAGLLCGSEGTLGIVTAARLRLVPDPTERTTALVGFASAASARAAAWALRRAVPSVEVVEFLTGACLAFVADTFGLVPPVDAPAVLLVEAAADADPTAEVATALDALEVAPTAGAVATDARRRGELWRLRDDLTAALATLGPVVKYDVSIPSAEIDAFVADADAAVGALAPGATTWWFGHVCDDNLHLNVTGGPDDTGALDARILELVAAHAGSISAEHGIGRAKARYLHLSRSAAEIDAMRAVKAALDPRRILNPGVLLGD